MRILSMIASPGPGGAEMLVRNLCAEFGQRGHTCHVLFMSDAASVGNPVAFEQDFLARLGEAGSSHEIMAPGSFRSALRSTRLLRKSVRRFRPDILHIHLARGLMCRSLAGISVPTVYTHHNVTANFPTWLFRWFDRSVDRYVAIGKACRAFLEKHVSGRIVSIPNGVPASYSTAGARRDIARNPLVLAVGNLSPQKDYASLIEAASLLIPRLEADGRRGRFAIAGEGAQRHTLELLISEHGLDGRFELLGARPDVARLMEQADLLVNSSAYEGLPLTLIEAAMAGLPVVATDVGGNSEVVLHRETGLIVPPSRPGPLADAIFSLLSDGSMHAAFSKAALEHSRNFTIENCAESHLEVYGSITAGRAVG